MNAKAPKRSEDDATALATELIRRARAGEDFSVLAKQYSDDPESKAKGGEFGSVTPLSGYAEAIKKAVLALRPNELSEPIRQPNSLYIIRVDNVTYPPVEKLYSDIINKIRDEHLNSIAAELAKRFNPEILKPEALLPKASQPGNPR